MIYPVFTPVSRAGVPGWVMIYPVFTPVSRAGKSGNNNKYFPALEKSFRTGYIIPHSGYRCPWKVVAGRVYHDSLRLSLPLKSRCWQGISFLTQVIAALEKSLLAGYIMTRSGYPLPEGKAWRKEFRYGRMYLGKYRPQGAWKEECRAWSVEWAAKD